ncbi:MAG: IS1380 family transposase [bacterium]|nr:IS1380 family transposase [bacterium]
MTTQPTPKKLALKGLGKRRLEADFSAGRVSSDGGGLLLREVDERLRLTQRLSHCFRDFRNPDLIEHTVQELVAQRVYGLALGYEDLNDHDQLSDDLLFAAMVGKVDVEGRKRVRSKDAGKALASPSTLGRIERTKETANNKTRYEKVVCDFDAVAALFVEVFIESFEHPPAVVVIDLDPSDIPLHGDQEQRAYHGYYRQHCYLPLYAFCAAHPLAMKLRPSKIDGAKGADEMLMWLVWQLRAAWPEVRIIVRADSGLCRDWLTSWCEDTPGVDYVLGLARNKRLVGAIAQQMEQARREFLQTGLPARRFRSFHYRTLKSWTRRRRVIGKAEYLPKGENPRFVVTSLSAREYEKRFVYEELYCARGEMENRIKEQQLDLFGDRASCHGFRGNEVRLWFSMAAHLLVEGLRRLGLQGTELAKAQASTLRVRLFKIGALVKVSVRRVHIRLSSAFPLQQLFADVLWRLRAPATG